MRVLISAVCDKSSPSSGGRHFVERPHLSQYEGIGVEGSTRLV